MGKPTAAVGEHRRTNRKAGARSILRVQLEDGIGNPRWVTVDLVDASERGIGVSSMAPLLPGSNILVRGHIGADGGDVKVRAVVRWCVEMISGGSSFRAGLEFLESDPAPPPAATPDPAEIDCYEVMQLSPNADAETISRVYRMLAQRYHPDNTETGDPEIFVRLVQAHRILIDPEQRAKYDVRHREMKQLHWKIFDQGRATVGKEAEQRKREGILGLLYNKALHDPERAAMSIIEFEKLLGCPREHLQAALWYLKGKGYIQRSDNSRFTITVQGFDKLEEHEIVAKKEGLRLLDPGAADSRNLWTRRDPA